LAWSQKLAAYWSISSPAFLASFAAVFWFTRKWSLDHLASHALMVSLVGNLVFYLVQLILTPRLVRKNYRSFRLNVVREDGEQTRRPSTPETVRLWIWILWPQIALLVLSNCVALYFAGNSEALGGVVTLTRWLQFLIVGPYAIGFGLQVRHPGFWIEARSCRNWQTAAMPQPDQSSPDSHLDP
jgi:hypothetical protein